MTTFTGHRVSLSASDWIKVGMFLLVQSAALIGVGMEMRERLAVVETQLKNRDESFNELRLEINELRKELAQRKG
jgi:hypothetical protein